MSDEAPDVATDNAEGLAVVSSDGLLLGTLVGVHRDQRNAAPGWAVLATDASVDGCFLVPFADASSHEEGFRLPFAASLVFTAPPVEDALHLSLRDAALQARHYGVAASGALRPSPDKESVAPARGVRSGAHQASEDQPRRPRKHRTP